jgi:DME family drug/metabolite transporter
LAGGDQDRPAAVRPEQLLAGGLLIVAVLALTGRRLPRSRAAWARIVTVGVLTSGYQTCYFASVSLTPVSLATLVAIGAFPVLVSTMEHVAVAGHPLSRQ